MSKAAPVIPHNVALIFNLSLSLSHYCYALTKKLFFEKIFLLISVNKEHNNGGFLGELDMLKFYHLILRIFLLHLHVYIWATWSDGAEISMLLISNSTTKDMNRFLIVSKCIGFNRFPLKIKLCSIGWQQVPVFSLLVWISLAHLIISSILIQLYLREK